MASVLSFLSFVMATHAAISRCFSLHVHLFLKPSNEFTTPLGGALLFILVPVDTYEDTQKAGQIRIMMLLGG